MYLENIVNGTLISTFLCVFSTLMLLLKKHNIKKHMREASPWIQAMTSKGLFKNKMFVHLFLNSFAWDLLYDDGHSRFYAVFADFKISSLKHHHYKAGPSQVNNEENSWVPCVSPGVGCLRIEQLDGGSHCGPPWDHSAHRSRLGGFSLCSEGPSESSLRLQRKLPPGERMGPKHLTVGLPHSPRSPRPSITQAGNPGAPRSHRGQGTGSHKADSVRAAPRHQPSCS